MKADIVIVGSGISALTAAALLAGKGKNVVVAEKQSRPGGSLRQFRRKKISFDVGFHYTGCLGDGEILDCLWRHCGVRSQVRVVPLTEDGYDRYDFADLDRPVRGYFSYPRLEEELCSRFPEDSSGIRTYLTTVRDVCREVPFYAMDRPLTPFLRGRKEDPRSFFDFLNGHIKSPQLRAVLAGPGFLYGVPTRQASLEVHALVAHGYYHGAYGVEGGGQEIVDGYVNRLTAIGARLLLDHCVEEIVVQSGKVAGVRFQNGEAIDCDTVIYTGHPATMLSRVPGSVFRPAYRHRLEDLRNTLSMFAVFGRSERCVAFRPDPLNYFAMPGHAEVLPTHDSGIVNDRPMMMTAARCGPQETLQQDQNGIILLRLGYWRDVSRFIDTIPGQRPKEYEDFKKQIAEQMITEAQKRWGELSGSIEPLAVGTPVTFRDELGAPDGCAYGAMHCLDQFNPEVRTRLPGLLLAGQSTLMTGVVGASISGLVAAGEILGLETLWEEVRK